MRKTSGFFRKTFGNNSGASPASPQARSSSNSVSAGSASAPTTPTSSRFPTTTSRKAPAVPEIPTVYARQPQAGATAPFASTAERTSLDAGAYKEERESVSRAQRPPTAEGAPSPPRKDAGGYRAQSSKTVDLTGGPAAGPAAESGMKASTTASSISSEQGRLARELQTWQMTEQSMGAEPAYSTSTIRPAGNGTRSNMSQTSPRAGGLQAAFSPPTANDAARAGTMPKTHRRTESGASVIMSGSIPSPPTGSLRAFGGPSSPDRGVMMSGSIPSPDLSGSSFHAAGAGAIGGTRQNSFASTVGSASSSGMQSSSSSTASDGTYGRSGHGAASPMFRTPVMSRNRNGTFTPRSEKLADRQAASGASGTNPNSSSFWLESSSSSSEDEDASDRREALHRLETLQMQQSKQHQQGTPTQQDVLTPLNGRQVRKRESAPSTPLAGGQSPGIRVVSSPAASAGGAAIGLGLGSDFSTGPGDAGPSAAARTRHSTAARPASANASPQLGSGVVPRLVTQSPSPAHQQVFTRPATASPAGTPSRSPAIGSTAGINMFPTSPASMQASGPGSKRSSSGLRTPTTTSDGTVPQTSPLPISLSERAAEFADKCWNEDESFLRKEKIAEWLGGFGELNQAALHAYMERFDFKGLRLDAAFRKLCEKLYLRAETQQVDRILAAFSSRFFEDNPDSVFGSIGER